MIKHSIYTAEQLNSWRDKAFSNAKAHGFHDSELSNEHWLMLIVTEISELVEADRKNRHADLAKFERTKIKDYGFETFVKDTFEDEMSDIAIRLFDLAGVLNLDFTESRVWIRDPKIEGQTVTEIAYTLTQMVVSRTTSVDHKVREALGFIFEWAYKLQIPLTTHINTKMMYNAGRPQKHDKKY